MIPASKALSSIEQAILGARRDEDRLTRMLASATEEAARLRARQAEAYKALARLKLDELAGEDAVGRLDVAERAAVEALERRKGALAGLAEDRVGLAAASADAEKARDGAAERVEAAVDAVEALVEKVRERLANDSEWLEDSAKVKTADAVAAAAADKASQSEADREEKRKPYEADSLFTYLWRRGYGTSEYRAGPLVRFFDARVARLIDYPSARPNYHMLNEIPLRLREHADRLKLAADEARTALQAFERRALEADGIRKLEADVETATNAHDKADQAVADLEAKLASLDAKHTAMLDGSRDESLNKALDGLAAAISREDLATLYNQAMATETPEDEKIVRELREIEPTLARREAEAEEVRKAAVELARKRTELEHSRDNFHRSRYDNPRGGFIDGAVIGSIITGILEGAMSSRNLDDALGKGFSIRKPPRGGSAFGGGIRFPSRPSAPSRPPSRPRGGFRTGGRF